jgi:hypothetical protein
MSKDLLGVVGSEASEGATVMACGGGFGGHRPPLREVHAMAK